jgi:aminopeptidase
MCVPNIPTEELSVTPHRDRVDGYVRSTKPLLYQGAFISDISVVFKNGSVVEANAARGGPTLRRLLDVDEGARRLGEVGLVPNSSPIAQSGILFQNTLFDENAASHLAFGQSFSSTLQDGRHLEAAALAQRGANSSVIHVDWMVGSNKLDVDALTETGDQEPLMRDGEWVTTTHQTSHVFPA